MRVVDNDPKVCNKNKDGDVTAKNQEGSTLAAITDAALAAIMDAAKSQTAGYFDLIAESEDKDGE